MIDPRAAQRRTVRVLAAGQVLGGLSFGATISLGAVLAARLSGNDALSGLAGAAVTLGTAITAIPLARLAQRRGRRPALASGMAIALAGVITVVGAVALGNFVLLLSAFALVGAGQAVNLQSRFAATDLATDASRGRDLSIVVWATTLGAVLGPNLIGPGQWLGDRVGMPQLTGPYLFTIVGQLLAITIYLTALRPDPLLIAQQVAAERGNQADRPTHPDRPRTAAVATVAIVTAHGVMVAIMSMTPVHLLHHGATLSVIGLTISLHIAGMYALSPVFGIVADRWGRTPTIVMGFVVLLACVAVIVGGTDDLRAVTVALVLLGVGWSMVTVAASALLTEATTEELRPRRQGRADSLMSLVGALGAISAGAILSQVGFGGLALSMIPVVVVASAVVLLPQRVARPA